MKADIEEAVANAEETVGFQIPKDVADAVLDYAKRKCTVCRHPDSYLPLLYENELTDYYMWKAINMRGAKTNGVFARLP